jgi:hypothetical protein
MKDLTRMTTDPQVMGGKSCIRDCALSNDPHYLNPFAQLTLSRGGTPYECFDQISRY